MHLRAGCAFIALVLGGIGCAEDEPSRFNSPPPSTTTAQDLSGWEFYTYELVEYACRPALGSFGDLDCVRFAGELPESDVIYVPDLHCSSVAGVALDCVDGQSDFYPSDLDGLDVTVIDGRQLACQAESCWEWDGQSSLDYRGKPDFTCNGDTCVPYGFELATIDGETVLCDVNSIQLRTPCWIVSNSGGSILDVPSALFPDFTCDFFDDCVRE